MDKGQITLTAFGIARIADAPTISPLEDGKVLWATSLNVALAVRSMNIVFKFSSKFACSGKFWHRHRRPRPVEYHSEREHHLNLIAAAERAKAAAREKGGAAALRALTMAQSQSVDSVATPASDEPSSPPQPTKQEMWVEIPTKKRMSQDRDDKDPIDRAVSPASSLSSASASDLRLAQR